MPLGEMPGSMSGLPQMPMMGVPQPTTNLLNILVDIAFGFAGGLMIFFGPMPVITYGTHLAEMLLKQTGYGSGPLASFGFSAAPYVVLAPVGGFALKELASVRSLKGFAYFAAAVLVGIAIAFVTKGYFSTVIHS